MKVHIYSVYRVYIAYKAKSQAGNIRVKYVMTTQKGQNRKKISQESQESPLGNLRIMLEIQQRASGPGESAAEAPYLSLRIFV